MLELIQFPWSPFCIAQRRILEYSGVRFQIVNIPNPDRSLVWELTRQRYYQVPVIRDGGTVVFETSEDSQIIAKYLNDKLELDLFPAKWRGVQSIIVRHVETEIESLTFKLNDIYWREFVPPRDALGFIRHKERKFGRYCLEHWRNEQALMLQELASKLTPYEQMLWQHPFLLDAKPRYLDFNLFGMLANLLYSGHYRLPAVHTQLQVWYDRISEEQLVHPKKRKMTNLKRK